MPVDIYPAQALGMTARQLRNFAANLGVGVMDLGDLQTAWSGAGFASTVQAGRVKMQPLVAGVPKGIFEVWNESALGLTHNNPDGTNPRLDQIVARAGDVPDLGASGNLGEIAIRTGTATGGATLDNRTGAATLAFNELLLYDVLVPAGAANGSTFSYRDRRPYGKPIIPRALTGGSPFDTASPQFLEAIESLQGTAIAVAATNYQSAAAVWLPNAITATKIRWSYQQGATAATGNYNIGIYDASGRKIVETGSVAFAGAANSTQLRTETISSTRFEAGVYYVVIGTTIATASSSVAFNGVPINTRRGRQGAVWYSTTGGVTLPTTILSFTDAFQTVSGQACAVPTVVLANG